MFDITESAARAARRLGPAVKLGGRRPRSDRGRPRIDPRVVAIVQEATGGYDRPAFGNLLAGITEQCRQAGLKPPSRATLYKLLATLPTPVYALADLPPAVRHALYNLGAASAVPAHQVAFYCFNYGDVAAMSFAAGLPWLALYQAARMRGHRERSRGLLDAVAHARGI